MLNFGSLVCKVAIVFLAHTALPRFLEACARGGFPKYPHMPKNASALSIGTP